MSLFTLPFRLAWFLIKLPFRLLGVGGGAPTAHPQLGASPSAPEPAGGALSGDFSAAPLPDFMQVDRASLRAKVEEALAVPAHPGWGAQIESLDAPIREKLAALDSMGGTDAYALALEIESLASTRASLAPLPPAEAQSDIAQQSQMSQAQHEMTMNIINNFPSGGGVVYDRYDANGRYKGRW